MKGRAPNAAEQRHLDRVVALGCIPCRDFFDAESDAEVHHIDGKTKPNAHKQIIPLCARHHRIPGEGYATRHGPGKNAGIVPFERAYGSEKDMLERVYELLGEPMPDNF